MTPLGSCSRSDELGREPRVDAPGACRLEQHRLEQVLGDPRRRGRALARALSLHHPLAHPLRQPAALSLRLDRRDERRPAEDPHARGDRLARLAHRRLEPELAEQLHRAPVHPPGARVNARPRMPLDEQRAHPVLREEQRGGEPDDASAHHQDRRSFRLPCRPSVGLNMQWVKTWCQSKIRPSEGEMETEKVGLRERKKQQTRLAILAGRDAADHRARLRAGDGGRGRGGGAGLGEHRLQLLRDEGGPVLRSRGGGRAGPEQRRAGPTKGRVGARGARAGGEGGAEGRRRRRVGEAGAPVRGRDRGEPSAPGPRAGALRAGRAAARADPLRRDRSEARRPDRPRRGGGGDRADANADPGAQGPAAPRGLAGEDPHRAARALREERRAASPWDRRLRPARP